VVTGAHITRYETTSPIKTKYLNVLSIAHSHDGFNKVSLK